MHCHLRRWLSHWNGPSKRRGLRVKVCAINFLSVDWETATVTFFILSCFCCCHAACRNEAKKKKQKQKVRSRQMRLQMALAFVQIGVWLAFRTCRATLFFCSNRNFRNWRNFLCVGLCSKPDLVEFRSLREALRCTTNCASNWHDDWTFRRMTSYMTERLLLTFDL